MDERGFWGGLEGKGEKRRRRRGRRGKRRNLKRVTRKGYICVFKEEYAAAAFRWDSFEKRERRGEGEKMFPFPPLPLFSFP